MKYEIFTVRDGFVIVNSTLLMVLGIPHTDKKVPNVIPKYQF